jgi:hypothetical protein
MQIKEIITESKLDGIKQMMADIGTGLIEPKVVQAVKNYMMKKLGAVQEPQQELQPEPQQRAEPQQVPNQQKAPVQQAPAQQPKVPPQQPQANVAPASTTIKPVPTVAEAKVKAQPVDIDVDADFEKILRTKFGEDADNIMTFVYRTNIQEICKEISVNKNFKPEAAELLYNMFYEAPGTLHDRNKIATIIRDEGVLDLKKFSKGGEGQILDLVKPTYKGNKLVQYLVGKLINRKDFPTQVSSANKGPGEDMITILGNPVMKLSPGDLNVGGLEVEVKAQGARLKGFGGGRIYGNGVQVYPQWASAISQALGTKGLQVLADYGLNLKNYYNFGDKTLNALAEALTAGNGKNKKATVVSAFDSMLEHVYPMSTTAMRKMITSVFQSNGSFEVDAFRRAWFLFSYEYYKLTTMDKETGKAMDSIMFIHQPSSSYKFVTNTNDFDFDKFTIDTSIYNWSDAPSVAPKITFGKEIRTRRSRAK